MLLFGHSHLRNADVRCTEVRIKSSCRVAFFSTTALDAAAALASALHLLEYARSELLQLPCQLLHLIHDEEDRYSSPYEHVRVFRLAPLHSVKRRTSPRAGQSMLNNLPTRSFDSDLRRRMSYIASSFR